jgi:hypothetical protein
MILNPHYEEIYEDIHFLEKTSYSGEIYVIGDPLYYFLSERNPIVSLPATWFHGVASLYIELEESLRTARPMYIFVANSKFETLRGITPGLTPYIDAVEQFIESNYRSTATSKGGTWYALGKEQLSTEGIEEPES